MSRNEWIKITDCPYSAAILIKLYHSGTLKRSDLNINGNAQTIKTALTFLEDLGYLTIRDIKIPRKTSEVNLTEKGERAARRFIALEDDTPEEDMITEHPRGIQNSIKKV